MNIAEFVKKYDLGEEMIHDLQMTIAHEAFNQTSMKKVGDFVQVMNHAIGSPTEPHLITERAMMFRLSLIVEELCELAHACGPNVRQQFVDYVTDRFDNLPPKENYDIVEVLDALVDLQYVLDGTTIMFGLAGIWPQAFDLVHANNMAKLTDNFDVAMETVDMYAKKGIHTQIEEQDILDIDKEKTYYRIVCTHDDNGNVKPGKILKPKNFEKVPLKELYEKYLHRFNEDMKK
jgi:predicted HAD superfamily Cof-like phosphohydrolase